MTSPSTSVHHKMSLNDGSAAPFLDGLAMAITDESTEDCCSCLASSTPAAAAAAADGWYLATTLLLLLLQLDIMADWGCCYLRAAAAAAQAICHSSDHQSIETRPLKSKNRNLKPIDLEKYQKRDVFNFMCCLLAKQSATEEFAKIRDQFCRERIIQGSFLMCVCFCTVVGHSVKRQGHLGNKSSWKCVAKRWEGFYLPFMH